MSTTSADTIFILEDDSVFRTRLARAFEGRGYQVVTAESCLEAECIESISDLNYAVLDLCLPDGNGLSVLQKLLQVCPDVTAVILTGYGTISTAVEAIKMGAAEFLTKPTNPDEILAALRGEESEKGTNAAPTLAQVEWEHMQRVLTDCGGNVTKAAKMLGLHRRSLQRKLSRDPGRLE